MSAEGPLQAAKISDEMAKPSWAERVMVHIGCRDCNARAATYIGPIRSI